MGGRITSSTAVTGWWYWYVGDGCDACMIHVMRAVYEIQIWTRARAPTFDVESDQMME